MSKNVQCQRILSIKQAAAYIGVSRGTLNQWLNRGLLPYEELPGRGGVYHFRRIRREDLDNFLEHHYRRSAVADRRNGTDSHLSHNEEDIILL